MVKCSKILNHGKRCSRILGKRGYCWQHQTLVKNQQGIQLGAGNCGSGACLGEDSAKDKAEVVVATSFKMPMKGVWQVYGSVNCGYTRGAIQFLQQNIATLSPQTKKIIFYDISKLWPQQSFSVQIFNLRSRLGLKSINGQQTIPMIFDNQKRFIGGFDKLQKLVK